jgi:secretion/DNA translocation related TadE-like protein
VTRRRPEAGAASLLVVTCAGLLLLVGCALSVVAAMVAAHRTAQTAADLAALAGATRLASGGDPCTAAQQVAHDNGARLTSCAVTDRDVTVEVEVTGPHWLGQRHDLAAQARAGPAQLSTTGSPLSS